MAMIEQFRQCGYKTEEVELTAETLTATEYATFWQDPVIAEESESNERRPDRPTFSGLQRVSGAYSGVFTGSFEPRPSGTDNTAPDWYALLKAAGFSVTGDVATWGAESTSGSIIGTACTIKTRDGAYERTLAGSRVSKLRFFAEAGGIWMCETEARGRYTEVPQVAFVAAAHPSAGLGQPFLGTACSIAGASAPVSAAEVSIEGTVTPVVDGTHASGRGKNIITDSKAMFRATVMEDGTTNWRDKYRGDAVGDIIAVSMAISQGTAGNVLTFTGNVTLSAQPTITYVEGIGYWQIEGEFITTGAAAALTLTQS